MYDKSEIIKLGLRIRIFEEYLLEIYSKGLLTGTVHTCIGQELIPSVIQSFIKDKDIVLSNHRGHGHYLAKTNDYRGLLAEIIGDFNGCSKGIGGSQHLYQKDSFYSNGIQGGMSPVAAGMAYYLKKYRSGSIVILYVGDGTLGEGQLYESLNAYSLWKLPVLVVIENNDWSQSTKSSSVRSGNIKNRIKGFGCEYIHTSTEDLNDLINKAKSATDKARESICAVLEIKTNRLKAHSKGDDNRPNRLLSEMNNKDLINFYLKEDTYLNYAKEFKSFIEALGKDIIENKTPYWEYMSNIPQETPADISINQDSSDRINTQIYNGLKCLLKNHKHSVMIGEDIEYISEGNEKPYGGAFKVTSDLSKIYHDKVMNTPISEGLIAGFVNGFSILGGIAIGEIMFGDFMTLTLDQILQHASKFKNMFGDEIPLRGVIRSPMGGRRGYGPTHSQSLHGHFLGIEGVNLYATNYRLNHEKFYASLPETNSYSIVFEDKVDYGLKPKENNLQYNEITGKGIIGKLQNEKSRIGIVGYGGFLKNIEDLVEEIYSEDKFAIDILWLVKLNRLILSDYNNFLTNKDILIFIDEGSKEGNVGQSFISGLTQHNNQNTLKIHHLSNDSTIPASSELEQVLLDFKKKIKSILWMSKE